MSSAAHARPSRRWTIILIAAAIIGMSFAVHEILEDHISRGIPPSYHPHVHALWGLITSLAITVLLLKSTIPDMGLPIDQAIAVHFTTPSDATAEQALAAKNRWLIEVRWAIFLAACCGIVVSRAVANLLPSTPLFDLLIAAACIPAGNLLFILWEKRSASKAAMLRAQMAFDLAILIAFIQLSGGIDSPLVLLVVLQPVLAGVLLQGLDALWFALSIPALLLGVHLGETAGWLGHYDADIPRESVLPVALALTLLALAFITTTVVRQLRRRESQLIQAGKMAAVGELAGAIAHEINNPLAIVTSKLDSLSRSAVTLPPATAHDLDKAGEHARRIAEIIKSLLAYSRPSHGRREPTDLNRLVADTVELVRGRALDAGVRLEPVPGANLPPARANFTEIEQVTLNLLNNALDAMPRGGTLRISTAERPPYLEIEVADTGCGMTAEVRSRLFEPFFTTKSESGGTGLGLAVCMGLVRSHGGRIEVESEPGVGSRFRVLLPAEAAG